VGEGTTDALGVDEGATDGDAAGDGAVLLALGVGEAVAATGAGEGVAAAGGVGLVLAADGPQAPTSVMTSRSAAPARGFTTAMLASRSACLP
jgi:hypothetical protein